MRQNPKPHEIVYDGLQINAALIAVYFGAYALDYKVLCLSSFISFMLITLHMVSVVNNAFPRVKRTELSQRQRDQGAQNSRGLTEEQEDVLYEQLHQVVDETRKRNQERRAMNRTPTGTSLAAEGAEDDEYADMPPLISLNKYSYADTPKKSYSIFDYNTMKLKDPIDEDIYADLPALVPLTTDIYRDFPSLSPSIPVIREILERTPMDDVD
jgi:hypothetical protein